MDGVATKSTRPACSDTWDTRKRRIQETKTDICLHRPAASG